MKSLSDKKSLSSFRKNLEFCVKLTGHETVGIVTDSLYKNIAKFISNALSTKHKVYILEIPTPERHSPPLPEVVYEFMDKVDFAITVASKSISHSEATQRAAKNGTKIVNMPMIDIRSITQGGLTADYSIIHEYTLRLKEALEPYTRFLIQYKGCEAKIVRGQRKLLATSGIMPDEFTMPMNLPDGEVTMAPLENTAEGTYYFDFLGPYGKNVTWHIHKGKITKVENASPEFLKILKTVPNANCIAELGIGTNYKALRINNILEAEKILGTVHLAVGKNTSLGGRIDAGFHIDGIALKPTLIGIKNNGTQTKIIERGKVLII